MIVDRRKRKINKHTVFNLSKIGIIYPLKLSVNFHTSAIKGTQDIHLKTIAEKKVKKLLLNRKCIKRKEKFKKINQKQKTV